MKIKVHSSVGRRRSSNQDYADFFTNDFGQVLCVLCDGVGGHQAGDVASYKTTNFIGQAFLRHSSAFTKQSIEDWMLTIIRDANHYIYQMSLEETHLKGMGTTLVIATVIDQTLIMAHVGDSRLYVFGHDQLTRLTEDHSLVNELIRSGEITVDEGQHHPQRNVVTRSIGGTDNVLPDIKVLPVEGIEMIMLCSDGLTNMVEEPELTKLFQNERYNEDFAEKLIQAANDAGGTDNITVVLVSQLQEEGVNS